MCLIAAAHGVLQRAASPRSLWRLTAGGVIRTLGGAISAQHCSGSIFSDAGVAVCAAPVALRTAMSSIRTGDALSQGTAAKPGQSLQTGKLRGASGPIGTRVAVVFSHGRLNHPEGSGQAGLMCGGSPHPGDGRRAVHTAGRGRVADCVCRTAVDVISAALGLIQRTAVVSICRAAAAGLTLLASPSIGTFMGSSEGQEGPTDHSPPLHLRKRLIVRCEESGD